MVTTRWMQTKDLDSVTSIELKNNEFYITKEELITLLRRKSVVAIVAIDNDKVIGFIVCELMNRRIQILDMAVHHAYQLKGVGTLLIDKLKEKLSPKKRTKISIEVRETNLGLQLFLQKKEFLGIEVLKDYYPDTHEDAFVMTFIVPTNSDVENSDVENS